MSRAGAHRVGHHVERTGERADPSGAISDAPEIAVTEAAQGPPERAQGRNDRPSDDPAEHHEGDRTQGEQQHDDDDRRGPERLGTVDLVELAVAELIVDAPLSGERFVVLRRSRTIVTSCDVRVGRGARLIDGER